VIGEAMASGVPCVVTDVGDSARIVGDVGRTIPPRDTDALVNAWRELLELSDAEKATLGVKARQRIDSHFSVDSLVTATVAALESLT
jgi:glycosyltransferase involved in cell wall biosynthesis